MSSSTIQKQFLSLFFICLLFVFCPYYSFAEMRKGGSSDGEIISLFFIVIVGGGLFITTIISFILLMIEYWTQSKDVETKATIALGFKVIIPLFAVILAALGAIFPAFALCIGSFLVYAVKLSVEKKETSETILPFFTKSLIGFIAFIFFLFIYCAF